MKPGFDETVAAAVESQTRLEAAIVDLTDTQMRAASLLPGWSGGHVITHLSRNADALRRLCLGVLSGVPQEMYPGGPVARDSAIEEGAGRPPALLAADLNFAGRRLLDLMREIGPDLRDVQVKWRRPLVAADIPMLRLQEIEIHHFDLGIGYQWSAKFVEWKLEVELPALRAKVPDIAIPSLPPAQLLAWLTGRPTREGLPAVPSWPF